MKWHYAKIIGTQKSEEVNANANADLRLPFLSMPPNLFYIYQAFFQLWYAYATTVVVAAATTKSMGPARGGAG